MLCIVAEGLYRNAPPRTFPVLALALGVGGDGGGSGGVGGREAEIVVAKPKPFLSAPWNGSRTRTQSAGSINNDGTVTIIDSTLSDNISRRSWVGTASSILER
jgi:hypothetical protein